MKTINLIQGSQEWLAFRKNHLGASDAAIIMGVYKWNKTPKMLWEEKLGLAEHSSDNAATRFGKANEANAREVYEEMMGEKYDAAIVMNDAYPILMASLDGLNAAQTNAVEIKCAGNEDHQTAKEGKVPLHYYPQVQMQLLVTGLDSLDYFSFHKEEGVIVEVKRDDKYIANMVMELNKFWAHVLDLVEPRLTDKDFVEGNDDWYKQAFRLLQIKESIKGLESEKKTIEDYLKNFSDKQNTAFKDLSYKRSVIPGRIDYKAIPELLNVNLEPYRGKPSERWTLSLKK